MGLLIDGSLVMADIMAFHDRFTRVAKKVDLSEFDTYHTVTTNIGDRCLSYQLGTRKVEVSIQHVNVQLSFYIDETLTLSSVFPQREVDGRINSALRWLLGQVISVEALPQEVIRVTSPEDNKYYNSVQLVVQINSSYEVSQLYKEVKERRWSYKQDMGGPLKMIGKVANQEIWVMPQIHTIEGVNVLYIQPTSTLVQWDMIEEWVNQRVPEGTVLLNGPCRMLTEIRDIVNNMKKSACRQQ